MGDSDIAAILKRIERKLDQLLAALADEDEREQEYSLDGDAIPLARDQDQPL